MIDKRFSIEAFEKTDETSTEKTDLLRDLGDEMASIINEATENAFKEIATKLIELGHKLEEQPKEYDTEFHSTDYEYLDPTNINAVRIWLSTQTDAMVGYKTLEEIENEENA